MKVLTRKWFINNFPEVWKRNYFNEETGRWRTMDGISLDSEIIYNQLLEFKPQTGDAAVAMTGANWAANYFELKCMLCDRDSVALAIIEDVCDYTDIEICPFCLKEALQSIEEAVLYDSNTNP